MRLVEQFDGKNFHTWKFKMELILSEKDLRDIVMGEEEVPDNDASAQIIRNYQKPERKAFCMICLNLANNQLLQVRKAQSARATWELLCTQYEVKTIHITYSLEEDSSPSKWMKW